MTAVAQEVYPVQMYRTSVDREQVSEDTPEGSFLFYNLRRKKVSVIRIGRIHSDALGFGTSVIRRAFSASIQRGFKGRINLTASWTSHLFYLKMGMQPQGKNLSALSHYLGRYRLDDFLSDASIFIQTVRKLESGSELSQRDEKLIKIYKQVLCIKEDQIDRTAAKQISHQELIERMHEVVTMKISSLWNLLQTELFPAIERAKPMDRPYTYMMGAVEMKMSQEGIARWKQDVDGTKPFESFKHLEHLHSLLYPWQVEKLISTFAEARQRRVRV